MAFITAGDPDYATCEKILDGLPAAGADIIELGMPFSDPMADGPAVQASSLRALKSGQTMRKTLELVRTFRARHPDTPIVLFGYYNPVYVYPSRALPRRGESRRRRWPPDRRPAAGGGRGAVPAGLARGLNFIRLATPTTDARRLPAVLANTSGFLYYVSITGITGTAAPDVAAVHAHVARIKETARLPVAVGFGVTTPAQAAAIAAGADGVVVGSALVNAIRDSLGPNGETTGKTTSNVLDLVKSLSAALRRA